jgi:hypothetical protein
MCLTNRAGPLRTRLETARASERAGGKEKAANNE